MQFLLIAIIFLMAGLGFLAVSLLQKEVAKEKALQSRLVDAEKKILGLTPTSTVRGIEEEPLDDMACPKNGIEEMGSGVYWILLSGRMWTIDTNKSKFFSAPGDCGTGYSTSTRDGLFNVSWDFYSPAQREDFFVVSSGEPIVSVVTNLWSGVSLTTNDKELHIDLNVPDCGKEFSSDKSFSYPVKDLLVNDRHVALPGQHMAACSMDGESGGMIVTDEIRFAEISLAKHQATFILPWGDFVTVNLDLDPAKAAISPKL